MQPFLTTTHGVLYAGDCLSLMRQLRSETFDCVFADPPFNLGKDYKNSFNDSLAAGDYHDWCASWIRECMRLLKPGGAFFVYAIPRHAVRFAALMEEQLEFRHWIALTMKGTYPRGRKLYPAHYALLYYTKGRPRVFNRVRLPVPTCRHCGGEIKDYGGHRDKLNPKGLNLSDFWENTSPNRHKRYKVRQGVNELKLVIPERAVLISTDPEDLVFDPFGGGGSTYQAAQLHGRHWFGIELHDCHHIRRRLKEEYPLSLDKEPAFNVGSLFRDEDSKHEVLRRRARQSV